MYVDQITQLKKQKKNKNKKRDLTKNAKNHWWTWFFSWNKRQKNKARKNNKNKGKKRNKKARKEQKKKKHDRERERDREWKRKRERSQRERKGDAEREQNNPFAGENPVWVKRQKQKILRRVEGQQPQNTHGGFFLSLRSFHGHLSSSSALFIAKCHSSCSFFLTFGVMFFFFLVVVFRCLFPSLSLLCSLLVIQLFLVLAISLCVAQKSDQITKYSKRWFECSALVPASSHFHLVQLRNPTRPKEKHPSKWYLFHSLWFLTMCWNTKFYSVLEHEPKVPPMKMGPKENDKLSQCVKPKLVSKKWSFWENLKILMFTDTHNFK